MRFIDALSLSTRMFKTRPMRTALTILGVGVGIGAVLFLVSLGYGLQNVILGQITTADALLTLDVSPGTSRFITLDRKSIWEMKAIENVVEVSPVISESAQLSIGELTGDGIMYAVEPSFFRLSGMKPEYGEMPHHEDQREIVISSAGLQLYDLSEEEVIGKDVYLTFFLPQEDNQGLEQVEIIKREEPYNIVGVVKDDSISFVYILSSTISDVKIDNFVQAKVKVKEDIHLAVVRDKIINKGFLVSALLDTIEQANKIFRGIQLVLGLFGLVALSVSAIGMFNTMTVTLLERINEIGIMRSIGVTKRDIKILFLVESMLIGFLGGVGGVLIGYFGGEVANFFINVLAKNFGGQALDLFYSPMWFVLIIISFSTVIGFLTGVFPSRRAANLNPLEALRYK